MGLLASVLALGGTYVAWRRLDGRTAPHQVTSEQGRVPSDQVETGLLAGKIPYIRGGSGPRHAVMFFGGNALFKRLDQSSGPGRYAGQIASLLPEGFRFTILGYEETPLPDNVLDTIVRDMAHVVRTDIGKQDLVTAVSFGGFVAQRFAADHPDLVDRLVLLVSGYRFSEEGWVAMERQFKALETGDFHSLVTDSVLLFRRPWYNWLVRLKLWKDRDHSASEFKDPRLILWSYRSLFYEDFARNPDFARRITAPTLVIGGAADQFFGPRVFEGETHMLPIERSGDVAGAVAAFLAEDLYAGPGRVRGGSLIPSS
jgi:pimeloyl-ACP methyl ester carboxylesterase